MGQADVEMQPVTSSNVAAIGYDEPEQDLYVRFLRTGATYVYGGVPVDVWEAMLADPSPGSFVHRVLKQYTYTIL